MGKVPEDTRPPTAGATTTLSPNWFLMASGSAGLKLRNAT